MSGRPDAHDAKRSSIARDRGADATQRIEDRPQFAPFVGCCAGAASRMSRLDIRWAEKTPKFQRDACTG
jgi:hypothetical protein